MYAGPGPIGERRFSFAWFLIPLCLVLAAPIGAGVWLHNELVAQREAVDAAWAQIESNYRRRADLVPALVEAVRGHMRHEAETFERVVRVRNQALERFSVAAQQLSDAQQDSDRALAALGGAVPSDPNDLKRLSTSQAQIGRGIRQVLTLAESYPELRSADHFLELQAQLEGTENRINVARMGFNEAVREYNSALEQLPTRYVAQARGFERRSYFRTDESDRRAAPLGFD